MEGYGRGLDVRRVKSKYDITRIEMVKSALKEGLNPLGHTIHTSMSSITLSAMDIFAYAMETKKPFSIIISGRKK